MRLDPAAIVLAFNAGLLLTLLLRPIWLRLRAPRSALLLWALPMAFALAACLPVGPAPAPFRLQAVATTQAMLPALMQASEATRLPWLLVVSMLGTIALWALMFSRYRLLRRRLHSEHREFDQRCPGLPIVRADFGPALFGLWRPQMVLPADFEMRYAPRQQQLALCHEYQHWRSGDPLVRALAWLAVSLQWWNPLLWWALPRLIEDQELACDARVLTLNPDALRDYASTLVAGQEHAESDALLCFLHQRHPLLRRIEMLKHHAEHPLRKRLSLVASWACLILTSSLVWAANPEGVVSDQNYRIAFVLQIDEGESAEFAVAGPGGEPMSARVDGDAGEVEIEATVTPTALAEHVLIAMRLSRNGEEFAKPSLQVKLGGAARIEAGDSTDGGFVGVRIDATVERFDPINAEAHADTASSTDREHPPAMPFSRLEPTALRNDLGPRLGGGTWLDASAEQEDDC